jgi:hypothetical protein
MLVAFLRNHHPVETSFSEAANRPQARVQSVEIDSGKGKTKPGCGGSVSFRWVDPVDSIHVSTFSFMYVGGQWKTVGFDFPPAATLNPKARTSGPNDKP